MNRRAVPPLDPVALRSADDAFYIRHPELAPGGKRMPIPITPGDPCAQLWRGQWLSEYEKAGGKVETVVASPPAGCGVMPCPKLKTKKTLSADEAKSLFKKLAAMPTVPFDYPVDCCYSRAHAMCRNLIDRGVDCNKVWYFAKDWGTAAVSADLHPVRPDGKPVSFPSAATGKDRAVRWVYHVAPTVEVLQPDGSIVRQVMDPSLADKPVTVDQWKAIQGTPIGAYEETTGPDAYFSNKKHAVLELDPTMEIACAQMATHRIDRDAARSSMSAKP